MSKTASEISDKELSEMTLHQLLDWSTEFGVGFEEVQARSNRIMPHVNRLRDEDFEEWERQFDSHTIKDPTPEQLDRWIENAPSVKDRLERIENVYGAERRLQEEVNLKKNEETDNPPKLTSVKLESIDNDDTKALKPSIILRLVTTKLALPIGAALAIGTSMLFWDFDGNIRRRGGFYRALVSVFGQEGTAIVLGLFLGGLVFWWLSGLDEEIPSHQKEQMKKLVNLRFLSGENYNKIILTGIFLVLIVIAFLLS